MNTRVLEFFDCLLKSADSEKILIVSSVVDSTLEGYFGVSGKHALDNVRIGVYVYERFDWEISGDFVPSINYPLGKDWDERDRLFYFSPEL